MADVFDLSFCPWKSIDEVSNLFLSLCLGRLWFSNEVDDLKKAQGSEEVRQVVELVFVGFGDSLPLHHSGHREGGKTDHRSVHD